MLLLQKINSSAKQERIFLFHKIYAILKLPLNQQLDLNFTNAPTFVFYDKGGSFLSP